MLKRLRISALVSLSLLVPAYLIAGCGSSGGGGGGGSDADGDGYASDVDCDDADASVHPEQDEPCVCDKIDQNCNGVVDDFPCALACSVDNDGDGSSPPDDCNDNDATIHPGQTEPCACDMIDQDCNGVIDDFPCDLACVVDMDMDGHPAGADCNDNDPTIHPGQAEPCVCDMIDQDCNGVIDDFPCDLACPGDIDADMDGYSSDVDCNDNDPTIHPDPNQEACVCDGIDQNCNGIIDDMPCDIACMYAMEGELCAPGQTPACGQGLSCCYPCGVQGCDFTCTQTCTDPQCSGGCPLLP
jgi:hypothetical protein